MNVQEKLRPRFTYLVEHIRNGEVIDSEVTHNLVPIEGLNHFAGVALKGVAQVGTWYIGLYEGNYTPQLSDTAATLPAAATEVTAYDEATREALVLGTVSGGAVNNSASPAEFTASATKTIRGGFISSAGGKGATTGVLASVIKFTTPKALDDGDVLRVTAGFTFASI